MKKILVASLFIAAAIACGGGASEKAKETAAAAPTETAAPSVSDNPDYQKGLELVAKSDCLTCHKVAEKNIGPAYQEVAAKYENTEANVKMLAEKIIKGGKGNWGEVMMTAHPTVSQADAEQMVKYILLLKK
ncbi:MAG: c-type cytochrome [Chitinophagales bacterium]|jgi:cytochrome c|nr:c-type cytochrome [Chitinophagales bacterium]